MYNNKFDRFLRWTLSIYSGMTLTLVFLPFSVNVILALNLTLLNKHPVMELMIIILVSSVILTVAIYYILQFILMHFASKLDIFINSLDNATVGILISLILTFAIVYCIYNGYTNKSMPSDVYKHIISPALKILTILIALCGVGIFHQADLQINVLGRGIESNGRSSKINSSNKKIFVTVTNVGNLATEVAFLGIGKRNRPYYEDLVNSNTIINGLIKSDQKLDLVKPDFHKLDKGMSISEIEINTGSLRKKVETYLKKGKVKLYLYFMDNTKKIYVQKLSLKYPDKEQSDTRKSDISDSDLQRIKDIIQIGKYHRLGDETILDDILQIFNKKYTEDIIKQVVENNVQK